MNLRELASPIRIYWDVTPVPDNPGIDYEGICDQLVANKILSLQVSDAGPVLALPTLRILERLKDRNIALSLSVSPAALTDQVIASLRGLPLRGVFVTVSSVEELSFVPGVRDRLQPKIPVGISFPVSRNNYRRLPEVLSFCVSNGLSFLALPMQRLMYEKECFSISKQERTGLAAELAGIAIPPHLKLIIHDPFLWRVFYPAVAFPDGGCQAANTMLYIAPDSAVYPCPVVPVTIGSLTATSLRDLIRSEAKTGLRRQLAATPGGCQGCEDLAQCKGGCRGRAFVMSSSLDEADPSCG